MTNEEHIAYILSFIPQDHALRQGAEALAKDASTESLVGILEMAQIARGPIPHRFVTNGWHVLVSSGFVTGPGLPKLCVCELWAEYEALAGTQVSTVTGAPTVAGPGTVRDYLGLCIDNGLVQVQVKGRLRSGDDRLTIEVEEPEP